MLQDQSSAGREKIDGLKDKLSGMKDQIQQVRTRMQAVDTHGWAGELGGRAPHTLHHATPRHATPRCAHQAEKDVALKSERVQELMKQKESEMTDAFKELEAEVHARTHARMRADARMHAHMHARTHKVSTRSKLSIKQKTMIGHKHGSIQADEKKLAEVARPPARPPARPLAGAAGRER